MLEVYELGNPDSQLTLIQPVDVHSLALIENEIAVIRNKTDKDFGFVAFKVDDWNSDLSPWTAPAVFGDNAFGGQAKRTLEEILRYCENRPATYYIGGYSLAGLFSIWAAYQTDMFSAVAAVSPSMWFPGFSAYMRENGIKCKNVYLSLGDKEEKVKNPVMATVGDNIRAAESLLKERGVNCTFEWNPGNHFKDANLRTAKGFLQLMNLPLCQI